MTRTSCPPLPVSFHSPVFRRRRTVAQSILPDLVRRVKPSVVAIATYDLDITKR